MGESRGSRKSESNNQDIVCEEISIFNKRKGQGNIVLSRLEIAEWFRVWGEVLSDPSSVLSSYTAV